MKFQNLTRFTRENSKIQKTNYSDIIAKERVKRIKRKEKYKWKTLLTMHKRINQDAVKIASKHSLSRTKIDI